MPRGRRIPVSGPGLCFWPSGIRRHHLAELGLERRRILDDILQPGALFDDGRGPVALTFPRQRPPQQQLLQEALHASGHLALVVTPESGDFIGEQCLVNLVPFARRDEGGRLLGPGVEILLVELAIGTHKLVLLSMCALPTGLRPAHGACGAPTAAALSRNGRGNGIKPQREFGPHIEQRERGRHGQAFCRDRVTPKLASG